MTDCSFANNVASGLHNNEDETFRAIFISCDFIYSNLSFDNCTGSFRGGAINIGLVGNRSIRPADNYTRSTITNCRISTSLGRYGGAICYEADPTNTADTNIRLEGFDIDSCTGSDNGGVLQ